MLNRRALLTGLLLPAIARAATPSPIQSIALALAAMAPGPALLASYPAGAPQALQNVAFVYDNALALIALQTAGRTADATRIGEAFLLAEGHDRFWHDGRLRNAYPAGPMTTPALPGYWNATAKLWSEDPYQVGSASGNVAWAALALLHLREPRFTAAARRMVHWLSTAAWNQGVIGGFFSEEPNPIQQNWRSTEQNIDAAVVMRTVQDPHATLCRAFVAAQFDPLRCCFNTGTSPGPTALDANLWPLLAFPDAPPAWRRALDWVLAHHQSEGGLGFRENPDGMWTEGTAQGALTFALQGRPAIAAKFLAALSAMAAPNGYLYAAKHEIRTGLAIGPNSTTDDFRYYRLPHLGATAWTALAISRSNPFLIRANSS